MHGILAALWFCTLTLTAAAADGRAAPAQAPPRTAGAQPASPTVEQEVRENILRQPVGRQTVADLNLPEPFLRRLVDTIIRAAYEDRFRIVVRDAKARTESGDAPVPPAPKVHRAVPGSITMFEPPMTQAMLRYRRPLPQGRPPNRGFTAALGQPEGAWPFDQPGEYAAAALRQASDLAGKRLAFDGLLDALAQVVAMLGSEAFASVDEADLARLREAGLPIDLLRHFTLDGGKGERHIVEVIAKRLQSGSALADVRAHARGAIFEFEPSHRGFGAASESGEHNAGAVRAQMTRGGYWRAYGDGGNADLLRQAVAAMPEAQFIVSIENRFGAEFADCAATWPLTRAEQLVIVPEAMTVAQWAADNAKAGVVADEQGRQRWAMLVPRYASWGDDGSTFVPGETFLLAGAAGALQAELIQSPLLFQGGNILCVRDPASGERLLLVGDAEIARNTALGLTPEQAREALRVEFKADRCIVLPAMSFHLDYDVSVRARGSGRASGTSGGPGRLVALVNDPVYASVLVLKAGLEPLRQAGVIDEATAHGALQALGRRDWRGFLDAVAPGVYATGPNGQFPLSLAERFSTSPVDSAVANLQRFLLALDFIVSLDLKAGELPGDRHARSCLESMQRRERDREAFHQALRDAGFEVVPVPSIANERRSMTAINGIHLKDRYLMPATGGLYAEVDAAAEAALRRALGPEVRIVPIICGESQRRCGAVHCSLSVFPALPVSGVGPVPLSDGPTR